MLSWLSLASHLGAVVVALLVWDTWTPQTPCPWTPCTWEVQQCLPPLETPSLHSHLLAAGSDQATHHGYARYYEPLLAPFRDAPVRLLEIGVESGHSLTAWRQYFHAAEHIWGVGLGEGDGDSPTLSGKVDWGEDGVAECSEAPGPPCSVVRGDQSDTAFLAQLIARTGGNYSVVIDDGSHLPSHQLLTLEALWPSLAPGGLYIVEDVETSYWGPHAALYGYSYSDQESFVERMKLVADTVNREYRLGKLTLPPLYNTVSSIMFGQNIVALRKQTEGESHYFHRDYRFKFQVTESFL